MTENFNVEQKNYFKSGGKITIDMLNNISNDAGKSSSNVNKLLYTPGVLFLPQEVSSNFMIESAVEGSGTNVKINVGYISSSGNSAYGGMAIDKDGKFIAIHKNEAYVGCTNTALNYNFSTLSWTTPVRADDPDLALTDGTGVTGKYSRSSGNYKIPLYIDSTLTAANNTNYVYIKYVEIVEQTSGTAQSASDGTQTYQYETHYVGGYAVRIINPNVAASLVQDGLSSSNFDTVLRELGYIKLGEVYLSVDANNNWSIEGTSQIQGLPTPSTTQYGYLNGGTVGAEFVGFTGNIAYPTIAGGYIDLFTHVNALGTGSISATNPHALSATDLGININNTNVHSVSTIIPVAGCTYTYANPVLNLAANDTLAVAYDTILVDTLTISNASQLTIRLPEAAEARISYRYTIKRIDSASTNTVSISTFGTAGRTSNMIDNQTVDANGYSVLPLGILGSTNDHVTVCVARNASNNYNWYTI